MAGETFFRAGPAAGDYAFNRDEPTRADVREFCEDLWARFAPYCPHPEHFLSAAMQEFHERTWEMILACSLLDRGFKLERPPKDGPDIKLIGGPRQARWPVWVEATTTDLGDVGRRDGSPNPDRAERRILYEIPLEDDDGKPMAGVKSFRYENRPEKTALRFTNALHAKTRQLEEFRRRVIVAPDDAYVVAINAARLHDDSFDDADPEVLKSVYPIGDCYISITPGSDAPPQVHYGYRGEVTKASGAPVATTAFLTPSYSGVSALLHSRTRAWNPNSEAPNYMLTIHNRSATNPLPQGFFPFGREAVPVGNQIEWVKYPGSPANAAGRSVAILSSR